MAKGRPGRVHRAEQVVGLLPFDDVEQVAGEPEDHRYRRAVRRRHLGKGVKELVDPRERVDHQHGLAVEVGGRGGGWDVGCHLADSIPATLPEETAPAQSPLGGSYSKSFHFMARRKGSMRSTTSPLWKILTVPLVSLTATATLLVRRVTAAAAQ